jgi:hypothetical protein
MLTYSVSFLSVGGGREEGKMEKYKGASTSYVKCQPFKQYRISAGSVLQKQMSM